MPWILTFSSPQYNQVVYGEITEKLVKSTLAAKTTVKATSDGCTISAVILTLTVIISSCDDGIAEIIPIDQPPEPCYLTFMAQKLLKEQFYILKSTMLLEVKKREH